MCCSTTITVQCNGVQMPQVLTGSVNPEGVTAAAVGSIYNQIVGGRLLQTWTKVTGDNSSSGWQ